MPLSTPLPSIRSQLTALCETHPQAPKFVLVPRTQIGRATEDTLARSQPSGWAGVEATTVRRFAERIAHFKMYASGRDELPLAGRPFLAARLLERIDPDAHELPGRHQVAGTVAEVIETLRRGGADVEAVRTRAQSPEASATFGLVADCYERYLEALSEEGFRDDAQVFRWATEHVEERTAPEVRQSVVAVADEVKLPELAYRFLQAVRSACAAFYRIGTPDPDGAPAHVAAALFSEASTPGPSEDSSPTAPEVHTGRAVGAANEVKAVFRDLLDREAPLDEVEIAFTGERAYLSRIADQAREMGIPITLSTGVPASLTRTGKALLSFFEWIGEDFDAEPLVRMLRSGLLRIDRIRPEIEDKTGSVELDPHEVATLLAERRYEPGRAGYDKAFGAAIERRTERVEELKERGLEPNREETRVRHLEFVRRVVDSLLELVPREATIQEMAARSRQFIETFGPVDKPPEEKPEEERTVDEAARTVLWQRVDDLSRLPVEYESSGARLAALLRRWVEGQYVRAQHPRPGAAHVLPLESAGYGGRSHLYVVGMDSETLSTAAVEDAMLRDADRRALSESLEGVLPDSQAAPDETAWRNRRALARHRGSIHLYTRTFDVESGEERFPSPLFLQLERGGGQEPSTESAEEDARIQGFLPDPRGLLLNDPEAWLGAYRERATRGTPAETARSTLRDRHPWIVAGEAARAARHSDQYTSHDGLLEAGEYPELDFLREDYEGPPMSAGRLETFAETPYLYFLKYVLGVEPLDEPALDDEPWLNRLRRGTILHDTFEAFMETLEERGERPDSCRGHEDLLRKTLQERINEEIEKVAPPSTVVEESAYRRLLDDAMVFLRSEIEQCLTWEPLYHEVGFGYGPYRRREGDFGSVSLTVGGREMPLRGRMDRVDREPDGALAIWDYKTGSASSFEESDPLADGAQLQWALYAYALEHLDGQSVASSGYYFTSAEEMGTRLAFDPARHEAEVERLLDALGELARTGSFPMNPRARYLNAWKYRGYERLFLDLETRSADLGEKTYPDARPVPPSFD